MTVIVAQINSKKIFLTGAVKREGPLKFTYRMTVLQAISEAGGLTDYAKRKEIYVLHNENGRQYQASVQLHRRVEGRKHGAEHSALSRRHDRRAVKSYSFDARSAMLRDVAVVACARMS